MCRLVILAMTASILASRHTHSSASAARILGGARRARAPKMETLSPATSGTVLLRIA
jgi:hypothetical protein